MATTTPPAPKVSGKKMDLSDPQIIKDACEMDKPEFLLKYAGQQTDGMLSLSWHNLRKTHIKSDTPAKPAKGNKEAPTKETKQKNPKPVKEKKEKAPSTPQAGVEDFIAEPAIKAILDNAEYSKSEKMRQLFTLGSIGEGEGAKKITPSIVSKLTDGHYSFVYGVYQRWLNPEVKEEKPAKETKPKKEKKAGKKEKEAPAEEPAADAANDAIAKRLEEAEPEEDIEETIEETEEVVEEVVEEKPKKKAAPKKAAGKKK